MARTGENIYKRKDGRWEARYIYVRDPSGKPRYKSLYGKTYAEVKQKLTQAAAEAALPKEDAEDSGNIKFEDLAGSWLERRLPPAAKESTHAQYTVLLNRHVIPYWRGRHVGRITTQEMESYISGLLQKGKTDERGGLSCKTVADIFIVMKSIFKSARRPVICDFSKIAVPKGGQVMRVFSKQEQRQLTALLLTDVDRMKVGVLLCLFTGIRIGELCALKGEDFDLTGRILHVGKTLQRINNLSGEDGTKTKIIITKPKSKKSERDIPIPKFLTPYLRKLASAPDAYLLTGVPDRFIEPRTMQNCFKRYLKQAGIKDANFHALRHTFSTTAIEQGFDIKSLSEILGHSNVNVTLNLYVHSSFELKQKYMDKMSPDKI